MSEKDVDIVRQVKTMDDKSRIQLSDAMNWALQDSADASMASADWLVSDIDPRYQSAVEMLVDRATPLKDLKLAKQIFKTMRIVGEEPRDRRLGSRLYLASIAAAYLYHDERISSQSDAALIRSLQSMAGDESIHDGLRTLASDSLLQFSPDDGISQNTAASKATSSSSNSDSSRLPM